MKHVRNLTTAGAVVAAALALTAPSALAVSTTVRVNDASGAAYAGNIRAGLIAPVQVTTSLGTSTCNTGNIDATVQSDGTALNISVYNFSHSPVPPGPECPNSAGGESTVSPVGLPWNGGNITFAPVVNGRDGTFTTAGVTVSSVSSTIFGTISCTYVGGGSGNSLTMDFYNSANAARPDTSVNQAQVKATSLTMNKSGGSGLCPATASFSATFSVLGETTAGSGVYDQKLHITA